MKRFVNLVLLGVFAIGLIAPVAGCKPAEETKPAANAPAGGEKKEEAK